MADISVNTGQQGRAQPGNDTVLATTANVAITALQACYFDATTGNLVLSDASVAGTAKFDGIAMNGAGAEGPVTLLKEGAVHGLDVSALDYGALLYLSDTAGAVADAAGTVSVVIGKVIKLNGEKVAYFDARYNV